MCAIQTPSAGALLGVRQYCLGGGGDGDRWHWAATYRAGMYIPVRAVVDVLRRSTSSPPSPLVRGGRHPKGAFLALK